METDDPVARTDFAGIAALSSRSAGYSVAAKCLQVQADTEALDPSLKSEDRVTLHDDARSWCQGALGEIAVGRLLSALGPKWFMRHAVPIGSGTKDVDHLVIGPGWDLCDQHQASRRRVGVGGRLHRSGKQLEQALPPRRPARRRRYRSTADCEGRIPGGGQLDNCCPCRAISQRLSSGGHQGGVRRRHAEPGLLAPFETARLSDTKLALIGMAAEEPGTWHVDPRAADTLRVMHRFDRLVSSVGPMTGPARPPIRPAGSKASSAPSSQRESVLRTRQAVLPRAIPRPEKRPTVRALFALWMWVWLAFGLAVVINIAAQLSASDPCSALVGCTYAALNVGLQPLLSLAPLAVFVVGCTKTVIGAVRRMSRSGTK